MTMCYDVASPVFPPAKRCIQSITQDLKAVVTTVIDHGYYSGAIVRLVIPTEYGMQEINNLTGTITVTGTNTFTIDIDSRLFDAFVDPGLPDVLQVYCPEVHPVGEIASTRESAVRNILN